MNEFTLKVIVENGCRVDLLWVESEYDKENSQAAHEHIEREVPKTIRFSAGDDCIGFSVMFNDDDAPTIKFQSDGDSGAPKRKVIMQTGEVKEL